MADECQTAYLNVCKTSSLNDKISWIWVLNPPLSGVRRYYYDKRFNRNDLQFFFFVSLTKLINFFSSLSDQWLIVNNGNDVAQIACIKKYTLDV